jgi:hypothetical protein
LYIDKLLKSRITHGYLVPDMSTFICAAAKNERNQILIRNHENVSPFSSFDRYYGKITEDFHEYISLLIHIDPNLSRDNLIQRNNETRYSPLNVLLRNTM